MRNYKIDNLKALLIFLVVLAHFFECFSGTVKYKLYLMIYMFHMPAFVFTTGYFAKPSIKNVLSKQLFPYIVFQIFYTLMNGQTVFMPQKPYWILWYLFACMGWTLSLYIVKSKYEIWIIISVLIALIVGYFDEIGTTFSLSRMFCFYPFFLLGVWFRKINLLEKTEGKKHKVIGLIALITGLVIAYMLLPNLHTTWLYHSTGYEFSKSNIIVRAELLGIGFLFTTALFLTIPNKEIKGFTFVGKYTLCIFLLHGFVVNLLRYNANPFIYAELINITLSILFSVVLFYSLGNPFALALLKPFTDFEFVCDKCRKIFTKSEKYDKIKRGI